MAVIPVQPALFTRASRSARCCSRLGSLGCGGGESAAAPELARPINGNVKLRSSFFMAILSRVQLRLHGLMLLDRFRNPGERGLAFAAERAMHRTADDIDVALFTVFGEVEANGFDFLICTQT